MVRVPLTSSETTFSESLIAVMARGRTRRRGGTKDGEQEPVIPLSWS